LPGIVCRSIARRCLARYCRQDLKLPYRHHFFITAMARQATSPFACLAFIVNIKAGCGIAYCHFGNRFVLFQLA